MNTKRVVLDDSCVHNTYVTYGGYRKGFPMLLRIFVWQDLGWWRCNIYFVSKKGNIIIVDLGAFQNKEDLETLKQAYVDYYMGKGAIK